MSIEVTAYPRTQQGTGASRRLRTSGRAPGIIYGGTKAVQMVELDQNALIRHLKMEVFHASILEMTVEGSKEQVLLRDFQMHPFKPFVLHVDFQRVDKNKKIHMSVPLHFINADICQGVKLGGGVVQHVMNEIEIRCLPDDLPKYIEVDLKDMEVGDSIHITDLTMPKGVEPLAKLKHDNPAVVALQLPKTVTAEEEVAAPVTEITGQAPEAEAAAGAEAGKKDADKKDAGKKEGDKKEAGKKE
jgi:large subunit ribosomal protein L25